MLLGLICALGLSACAVPHKRGDLSPEKTAARTPEVTAVFNRYRKVRNTAIELLDAKPLSIVESGPVLAIDYRFVRGVAAAGQDAEAGHWISRGHGRADPAIRQSTRCGSSRSCATPMRG